MVGWVWDGAGLSVRAPQIGGKITVGLHTYYRHTIDML